MKKRSLLFLYPIVVIVTLVVALVFGIKIKQKYFSTNKTEIEKVEQGDSPEDNTEDVENESGGEQEESQEVYANSLLVNLPTKMNILKGTTVELASGYLQVTPNEMLSKITVNINPTYNSAEDGLSFRNNILYANKVGTYQVKFSVPKSTSEHLTKTISITIFEEKTLAHVNQLRKSVYFNEHLSIADVFSINCELDFIVNASDILAIKNGNISLLSTGEGEIEFKFLEDHVVYNYQFKITIKDIPEYCFVFNDLKDNTIEIDLLQDDIFRIYYQINNRQEEAINQQISAVSQDETIARIEKIESPFIKIKGLKAGNTKIVLTYLKDTSVTFEITVIVK